MIAHAFPPQIGGVETHLWDISRHLCARGHSVQCLVGGAYASERHGGVYVVRHPALTIQYLLHRRNGLDRDHRSDDLCATLVDVVATALRAFKPDIIHAHNLVHFAPELAEALQRCGDGKPIVTSVHDRIGEHLFPEVMTLPWSHTLIASHYLRSSLPVCPSSSVLWLGIELQEFSPYGERDQRLLDMEHPVIFHPARLLRWKGVEVGLEAFGLLRKRLGKGTLVMCGSENAATDHEEISDLRRQLSDRADMLGMGDRIAFLEFTSSEMPVAYRASDVVWYPTIDEEPLGLVPIEAMACGVPIIVSASGGMLETVVNNQTGIVVPKNDALALAEAAERILLDESLRDRLVQGGIERAHTFDNASYVDQLMIVYKRALLQLGKT